MVRAYSLYFDRPAADWERRRKTVTLALVIAAHLAILGWFLRTFPPAPKNATSLVMVLLNNALSPPQVHTGPGKGASSAAEKPTASHHTDTTRGPDSTRTPVPEGHLAPGTAATTSAAEVGEATTAAGGSSSLRRGVAMRTPVFVPPRVLHHWRPPYPRDAYEEHAQGEAHILVTIASNGLLKDARLQTSSGNEELDQASLEAVRHYTFGAATQDGMLVDAQAVVVVEWSIRPALALKVVSGMTK